MGLINLNPPVQRIPANPLDKTTIFSIYPETIIHINPTISPGRFEIQAGKSDEPSYLVVGSSSWFRQMEEGMPTLEIPHSSIQIAESVIRDWSSGLFGVNYPSDVPGLFFLPGEHTDSKKLLENKDYHRLIELAKAKQRRWFENLVKLTDALWIGSKGNPLSVPAQSKIAAHDLGLKEKSWLGDHVMLTEMSPCPACGEMRKDKFPVCQSCHTIVDQKLYDKLNLKKAV